MRKLRLSGNLRLPSDGRTWSIFLVVAMVIALLMPTARQFEYDYHRGSPWKYPSLVADMDFPIYKTSAQMEQEMSGAGAEVIPYYKYSEEAGARVISAAEAVEFGSAVERQNVISALRSIYSRGVLPEDMPGRKNTSYSSDMVYVQKNKRAVKYPVTELYKLSEVKPRLISELAERMPDSNVDSLLRATDICDNLVSNLVFDPQTTRLVHSESDVTVSPTQGYVSSGTLIVSEGEIVTAEIKQMLDSYKREYEANTGADTPRAGVLAGNLLVAVALVLILFFTIFFVSPRGVTRRGELLFLVFTFLLVAVPVLIMGRMEASDRSFLILPFTLVALYLQSFYLDRVIVPVYMVSLLPLLVASPHGAAIYLMFVVAGLVSIWMFGRFFRGGQQFITAFITFGVLLAVYLGFRLLSVFGGNIWADIVALFIGSMLSVAAYPLTFLFEKVFGLLSNSTLVQLSDTGNKLLRELETKAPGTFQHSLQVMTMADAVARSIGADIYLIRVGGLYHDIGKMLNPRCFVENESLTGADSEVKYHAGLTPEQSAADIIKHVSDGVELAQARHLPKDVVDFISTHHGTSCTAFFYTKYLNDGGDPSGRDGFCYPGPKPRTREQAILMLCDSVEAASRTLKDYTPRSFGELVDKIVGGKISDGQLSESNITMRELEKVKEVLKSYLGQLYHERVEYPKRRKN